MRAQLFNLAKTALTKSSFSSKVFKSNFFLKSHSFSQMKFTSVIASKSNSLQTNSLTNTINMINSMLGICGLLEDSGG